MKKVLRFGLYRGYWAGLLLALLMFQGSAVAGQGDCAGVFLQQILAELDRAYEVQGRPAVSFDSLAQVKDEGVSRLEAKVREWPQGATFSISVLSDSIMVASFCQDKMQKDYWKPAGR